MVVWSTFFNYFFLQKIGAVDFCTMLIVLHAYSCTNLTNANQKAVKLSGLLDKNFILIYEELCFKCNQTHGSYQVCILLYNEAYLLIFFHFDNIYFSWLINAKFLNFTSVKNQHLYIYRRSDN